MATPFTTLYKKFLNQVEDNEFMLADDFTILELLENYLKNSVVDFNCCRVSLKYRESIDGKFYIEPTTEREYIFRDYIGRDIEFSIKDIDGLELQNNIDYKIIETLDELDNVTEIKILFSEDISKKLVINWRFEGEFLENLNEEEIFILTLGMTLHWLRTKISREDNLKQFISDKDFKQLSNANMLSRLMAYEKNTKELLKEYKESYNFKGFEGWN